MKTDTIEKSENKVRLTHLNKMEFKLRLELTKIAIEANRLKQKQGQE